MLDARLSLPTVLAVVVITAAASFAAGRSSSPATPLTSVAAASAEQGPLPELHESDELPPGHPPTAGALPHSHAFPAQAPVGEERDTTVAPAAPSPSLAWRAPGRWQAAPNTSSMRLATYRVPRADGDKEDADLSIMQAGGSVDANVARWVGQFDAAAQKTAKRSTRKVGTLEITVVEVQGDYSSGGMGTEPASGAGFALLGAIVATPGSPHFFKLTGPAKTVMAARAEFDALLASLTLPR